MPKIFDCFTFFNELDLLEIRLNVLNDVVDKFVLVEMGTSHTYNSKPFYFEENKSRFSTFLDKIIHVKISDLPKPIPSKLCTNGNNWQLENYQRDCIMCGLTEASDEDIVMISDLDEIPDPKAIKNYITSGSGIMILEQKMMYYFINNINYVEPLWKNGTHIAHFSELKDPGNIPVSNQLYWEFSKKGLPTYFRFCQGTHIKNAGWHFSYCGGIQKIIEKRKSICEQEYNTKENMAPNEILKRIYTGRDILDREYVYKVLHLDNSFPKYILENKEKYTHLILRQTMVQKLQNNIVIAKYNLNKVISFFNEKIHLVRKTLSPVKKFVFKLLGIKYIPRN